MTHDDALPFDIEECATVIGATPDESAAVVCGALDIDPAHRDAVRALVNEVEEGCDSSEVFTRRPRRLREGLTEKQI